jgi:hypothetical protein
MTLILIIWITMNQMIQRRFLLYPTKKKTFNSPRSVDDDDHDHDDDNDDEMMMMMMMMMMTRLLKLIVLMMEMMTMKIEMRCD